MEDNEDGFTSHTPNFSENAAASVFRDSLVFSNVVARPKQYNKELDSGDNQTVEYSNDDTILERSNGEATNVDISQVEESGNINIIKTDASSIMHQSREVNLPDPGSELELVPNDSNLSTDNVGPSANNNRNQHQELGPVPNSNLSIIINPAKPDLTEPGSQGDLSIDDTSFSNNINQQPHLLQPVDMSGITQTSSILSSKTNKRNLFRSARVPPLPLFKCFESASCDFTCSEAGTFASHLRSAHMKEKPHRCFYCSFQGHSIRDINEHLKDVHPTRKPYQCPYSIYAFDKTTANNSSGYNNNINETVPSSNSQTQTQTQSKSTSQQNLDDAATTANNNNNNNNIDKTSEYHVASLHKQHIIQCPYRALAPQSLRYHIRVNHSDVLQGKPYKCQYCNYSTVQRNHLDNHVRSIHTKDKPFQCDQCSYASAEKGALKRHKRYKHSDEKKYKCEHVGCNYKCLELSDLKKHHLYKHSKIKPRKCTWDKCTYSCVTLSDLSVHIRSQHTGEKLYQCNFNGCDYKGVTSGQLKSHAKKHTNALISCPAEGCKYTSTNRKTLVKHMERKHKIVGGGGVDDQTGIQGTDESVTSTITATGIGNIDKMKENTTGPITTLSIEPFEDINIKTETDLPIGIPGSVAISDPNSDLGDMGGAVHKNKRLLVE